LGQAVPKMAPGFEVSIRQHVGFVLDFLGQESHVPLEADNALPQLPFEFVHAHGFRRPGFRVGIDVGRFHRRFHHLVEGSWGPA